MKIALVSPLYESVPPKAYGGTERVVSYLTEELVAMGHDVTLFASGDSVTGAKLVAPCARSLRLDDACIDQMVHHVLLLDMVFQSARQFDIVHFHIDYLPFPLCRWIKFPHVSTLHGRLDIAELQPLYQAFAHEPLVSISDAQRLPLPNVEWVGTVHHGLPLDLFRPRHEAGKYLAVLGRISPEKGVDRAIRIAQRVGMPLKIAAKVDSKDQAYYETVIQPLLREAGPTAEFIGEIGGRAKEEFLRNAYALLFPIDWPEPFGLVMIEAMACGTPVIAWPHGSVPEVMQNGVTGYVIDSVDKAVRAVRRLDGFYRRRCRETFEERFSARRMAAGYLALYRKVLDEKRRTKRARAAAAVS